jgi:hypothetical protein
VSALDYAGTKLIGVRQIGKGGVKVSVLRDDSNLVLTSDEWEDLVHLAALFLARAKGEL